MTTPADLNPYEATPPRRPGLDDLGGALLVNFPPGPVADPSILDADSLNTMERIAISHACVVPHTIVTIDFNAGNPSIVGITSTNSNVAQISNSFTLGRHGGGDAHGDFDLAWPSQYIPAPIADPEASVTGDVDAAARTVALSSLGFRIRTRSFAGAGVDVRCQVRIY